MLSDDQIQTLKPKLLQTQIIAGLLLIGTLFGCFLIGMIFQWENANDRMKMLNMIATVTGVAIFLLSAIAPPMFSSTPRMGSNSQNDPAAVSSDAKRIANSLMTESIIRYLLIEGGIFLNLMVAIVEPHPASFVICGLGVFLMLVTFPRQTRLLATIDRRMGF